MRVTYILLLLFSITLFSSCSKDYLNVNEVNPNETQNPPINGLLASVTYQTGINVYRAADITSYYVQQLASPNAGSGSDIYDDVDRSTLWFNLTVEGAVNPGGGIYNTLADARVMLEKAQSLNGFQYVGVAKVTEAMNMSILIDLFGDVPYSEAFNGSNFTPKYDRAEDIFNACLRLLDEAVLEFDKADPGIILDPASDLIHGGSVDAWKKTANALKARLLNRLSKKDYKPAEILTALANAYTSNNDDAQLNTFNGRSPWNQVAFSNSQLILGGWMSEQFIDALNGTTYGVFDPRIKYITDTARFGIYKGTPNGQGRASGGTGTVKEESYLSLEGFYSKGGAPLLLVTYAEMKFIEAEATFASNKAQSYKAYLEGITANMDKIGVPEVERDAYLANPAVAPGEAGFTIDHIFKEKYVAMFLHPEAWTDARRYDYKYKDFTLPVGALLPTFIRRVNYPASEISRNSANVPEVGSLTEKLYFEK